MTDAPREFYAIAEWRIDRLTTLVEKLNRRAVKLGQEKIVVTTVGEHDEVFTQPNPNTSIWAHPEIEVRVRILHVTVTGAAPKLNGWAFLGTISHSGSPTLPNVFHAIPGETFPETYRFAPTRCDHCQTDRARKDTYVLRHESGDTKQVGKRCLRDFLGHADPHAVAAWAEALGALQQVLDEQDGDCSWDESFPRPRFFIAPDTFLACVASCIRNDGWLSNGKARDFGRDSTSEQARSLMLDLASTQTKSLVKPEYRLTDADHETADAALAWIRALDITWATGNDYRMNLYALCQRGTLEWRDLGLVASLIATYQRETAREIEQKAASATSHYFGTVGVRAAYTLTCLGVLELDGGEFGPTYLCRFLEGDGNRATWFASRCPDFAAGDILTAKATVKAHELYKGIEQTILTRVSVLTVTRGTATATPEA